MTQDILDKDIRDLIGLDGLSTDEQAKLLDDIGAVIMEGAVLQYLAEHSAEEGAAFERFVADNAEDDELIPKLLEAHPDFATALESEMVAFKTDAVAVLGEEKQKE